jgi:hypothetical protein
MVTAALVSFGLLVAAWIAAPDRARKAPMPGARVAMADPPQADPPQADPPQADAPEAAEPLAA